MHLCTMRRLAMDQVQRGQHVAMLDAVRKIIRFVHAYSKVRQACYVSHTRACEHGAFYATD